MKKIIVLFLILSNVSFAQKNPFGEVKVSSKKYYEEISFTTVVDKIIIPVEIKGKTYRFFVDTGAPNAISPQVFEELNLEEIQKPEKPFLIPISDANNLTDSLRLVNLPPLKIGNTSFENTKGMLIDFENNYMMKCLKIDGIIGSNLFVNSVVKFSMKNKKIYITESVKNLNSKTKGTKLSLINAQSMPFIKVNFLGKEDKKANEILLVDSGASGFYDVSKRAFEILNPNDFYGTVSQAEGLGGLGMYENTKSEIQNLVTIPSFMINRMSFENVQAVTTNDRNSRIGIQVLDYGDMILDFKKKKFYYESFSDKVIFDENRKIEISILEGNLIVGLVWDEKLKQIMSYGNKILRIDDLEFKDFCDFIAIKEYLLNKKSYEIEFLNNKNEKVIVTLNN